MSDKLPSLDPVLHQPVRTQIVAFLLGRGESSFSDLKQALEVTDGNLGAHLGKLLDAGYVGAQEGEGAGRPQTLYRLTPAGQAAMADYVARLSALMPLGRTEPEKPAPFKTPQPRGAR